MNTSVSPVLTLLLFFVGLAVWRFQTLEKRRLEITERALTAARNAMERIHHNRDATQDIKGCERWSQMYVLSILGRYQSSGDIFSELSTVRDLVELYYGVENAKPFTELEAINRDIGSALANLTNETGAQALYGDLDYRARKSGWQQTISQEPGGDAVQKRADAAWEEIKATYGRRLRPGFWDLIWPVQR